MPGVSPTMGTTDAWPKSSVPARPAHPLPASRKPEVTPCPSARAVEEAVGLEMVGRKELCHGTAWPQSGQPLPGSTEKITGSGKHFPRALESRFPRKISMLLDEELGKLGMYRVW